MSATEADKFLDIPTVQHRLGDCSRQTVYNLATKGVDGRKLPMVKLGRKSVIRESDLVAFIADAQPASLKTA